jgi:hypothetical protein
MLFDVLSNKYCRASMRRLIWMRYVVDDVIGYFYMTSSSEVGFRNKEDVYVKYL